MKISLELRSEMTVALVGHLILTDREWESHVFGEDAMFPDVPSDLHLNHLRVMAEAAMDFIYGKVDDDA